MRRRIDQCIGGFHTALRSALVAVIALAMLPQSAAAQYLSVAPDVPLAQGLREIPDAVLVFDKPQGRIVQIAAATQQDGVWSVDALQQFYRDSLPNLGWQEAAINGSHTKSAGQAAHARNGLTFTRKGEILRLTFSADLVIFDLAPTASTARSTQRGER